LIGEDTTCPRRGYRNREQSRAGQPFSVSLAVSASGGNGWVYARFRTTIGCGGWFCFFSPRRALQGCLAL